jgi:hypothetical protein
MYGLFARIVGSRGLSNRSGKALLGVVAALCGATGMFVVTTAAMDSLPDSLLIAGALVVAFLAVVALQWNSGLAEVLAADRVALGLAAAGGVLAFWAAPLLALSQRASDAPSGSESLFFTTCTWGLACVIAAFTLRRERPPVTSLAGAACAVAGAAGLMATWENPSSFSPFAKFPVREALMLAAGVLFAAGALALVTAARKAGPRAAVTTGLAGAAVLGGVVALFSVQAAGDLRGGVLLPCIYLGLTIAVFALGWVGAGSIVGVARSSIALLAVPLAVMALSVVERMTTMYGPSPIEWVAALCAGAVIVSGAVVVWLAEKPAEAAVVSAGRGYLVALGLAVGACVAAVASLATPALNAVAEGGTAQPFHAAWTMVGAESAAGWLAIAAAGLALAAVVVTRAGGSLRSWLPSGAAVVVCGLASLPLLGVTLHTWNQWVPAEVQQTYGTEYSRLLIEARIDPVRVAALVLAAAAVGVLAASFGSGRMAPDASKENE